MRRSNKDPSMLLRSRGGWDVEGAAGGVGVCWAADFGVVQAVGTVMMLGDEGEVEEEVDLVFGGGRETSFSSSHCFSDFIGRRGGEVDEGKGSGAGEETDEEAVGASAAISRGEGEGDSVEEDEEIELKISWTWGASNSAGSISSETPSRRERRSNGRVLATSCNDFKARFFIFGYDSAVKRDRERERDRQSSRDLGVGYDNQEIVDDHFYLLIHLAIRCGGAR
jgi:hypothetical protein